TCSGHFDRYVNKDATARIWDIKTGSQKFILEGHKTRVLRATFDHTGSLIVTSSDATRIWDAANGAQLATTSDTFEGFSPDDTSLLYRTTDGEVHIRDANGALQQSFKYYNSERINGASFGVDSSTVVTWHDDGSIRAHSFVPNPGRIVASRSFELGRDTKYSKYLDIAFSPDGKRVAMAGIGGVEIFDTTNGSKLDQFEQPTNKVAFGSSDSELLSASDDGAVRVENVVNRNATSEFRVDGTPLRAFSAGSRFLVVSAKDSVGEIWDARSGELISRLVGHTGEITSAAISRSAEFCATASKDNTLRIWRLSDGALLKTLEREVSGVEFSQLGNLLAAVGPSDVLVWDVKTGKERVTLDSRAVAVAFSRGDTRIVLGDRIGRAEIWDLGSGKLVHSFEHRLRTVPMVHVAFNPVADSLLLTWTGGFELWKFYSNVEDLVQASKTDATRCLTSKQRSDAFLSEDAPSWCSRMRKWPTGTASDIDPMQ
ncbi:WD40 repeat domain-containing protein, partial [Pseudorhodoplanes sp.]|uniref:WD40 repeat domain-containing protein n=1 Tax=Pseudorhodoplanes sp. TaxID=1934341 RepID=UPI003D0DCD7B